MKTTSLTSRFVLAFLLLLSFGTARAQDPAYGRFFATGKATYYSAKMHGRRMSNGERYDKHAFTCAHRTLPFGTLLRVVNKRNGKSTLVEVTDRGPFGRGLVVDLSNSAAAALDMLAAGVVPVDLYLEPPLEPSPSPIPDYLLLFKIEPPRIRIQWEWNIEHGTLRLYPEPVPFFPSSIHPSK